MALFNFCPANIFIGHARRRGLGLARPLPVATAAATTHTTASGCKLARSMFSFRAHLALLFGLLPKILQVCQMRHSFVALHCLPQAYNDDGDAADPIEQE